MEMEIKMEITFMLIICIIAINMTTIRKEYIIWKFKLHSVGVCWRISAISMGC